LDGSASGPRPQEGCEHVPFKSIYSLAILATLSKEDLKNCGIRLGHLTVFADLIDQDEQKKNRRVTQADATVFG